MKRAFDAFALAAAAVFALATAVTSARNSHFLRDDFAGFYLAHGEPLGRVLLTPIDVHFVPLHRLVNQLVYSAAPLDFGVAVAVLLAFHAIGVGALWATLRALKDSPVNGPLLFLYATNVYLGVLFLWWTSGLHRLPYVAFALLTLFHYLAYRRAGRPRNLIAAWVCFVAALGFYTKAALIPAVMLGLEICLLRGAPPGRLRRDLAVIAVFFATSALWIALTRSVVAGPFSQLHLDPGFLLDFELRSFAVLAAGVFGGVAGASGSWAPSATLVGAAWLAFIGYTIARRPWNAVVWSVAIALVALNFGVVAVSHRAAHYGLVLVTTPRYYFELMYLVVLFAGVALHDLPARPVASLPARGPRRRAAALAGAGGLLLACGATSFAHFEGLVASRRYRGNREARVFVHNLQSGLAAVRSRPQRDYAFVDGLVPSSLTGKTAAHVRRHSVFLQLFDFEPSFDPAAPTLYAIGEDGEVRRVGRRRR